MKSTIEIRYAAHHDDVKQWNTQRLKSGFSTTTDSEEIYFISNSATGLWRTK